MKDTPESDNPQRELLQARIDKLTEEINDAKSRARDHRRSSWSARLLANQLLEEMENIGLNLNHYQALVRGTERRIKAAEDKIEKLEKDLEREKIAKGIIITELILRQLEYEYLQRQYQEQKGSGSSDEDNDR